MPPRVLRSVDDLHQHELDWFCYQALRCIQMTNPDVVEEDIREGGEYRIHVTIWLTKVFDDGQWTSAEKPTVQSDRLRKQGASAYLRYRVDNLYDTVMAEYLDAKLRWVPADLIDFQNGEKPNIAIRSRAIMRQELYQRLLWELGMPIYWSIFSARDSGRTSIEPYPFTDYYT
ncbi:hypothetical protein PG984_001238 [Apiospora sp. TS-2023a]